jgi:hypothetical protein
MTMRAQGDCGRRKIGRSFLIVAAVSLALMGLAVALNNISLQSVSREQFTSQLDQALERGTAWVAAHADGMLEDRNSALFHMLAEMNARKPDARFRRLTERFLSQAGDSLWRKLVGDTGSASAPDLQGFDRLQDYQRWILFAIAPDRVPLSDEDKRRMFAPDEYHWGSLTHQLFAVYLFRRFQGTSPATETLMSHLCERIAAEAFWDVRVTDLYLQRSAFLLAAGRPDLVRRRWVERVMAAQQGDGGWVSGWHGWGPGLMAFSWSRRSSNAHTTVQGIWILHLLKYRYPEWIEQHYGR